MMWCEITRISFSKVTYKVGVGGKYQSWHAVIINALPSTNSLDLLIKAIMQFAWILNIRIIDFFNVSYLSIQSPLDNFLNNICYDLCSFLQYDQNDVLNSYIGSTVFHTSSIVSCSYFGFYEPYEWYKIIFCVILVKIDLLLVYNEKVKRMFYSFGSM